MKQLIFNTSPVVLYIGIYFGQTDTKPGPLAIGLPRRRSPTATSVLTFLFKLPPERDQVASHPLYGVAGASVLKRQRQSCSDVAAGTVAKAAILVAKVTSHRVIGVSVLKPQRHSVAKGLL